jgi:hypothetical protein
MSKAVPRANTAICSKTPKTAILYQKWYRLVDHNGLRNRDSHWLGHRDSNRLRYVYRDRHWVRDFNRDLHRIWDRLLDRVGHWFLYRHGIRLRDVNWIGSVYRNCYRNLHRNRNLLFNGYWIRLWHRDRDFLGDGDGFHVTLAISVSSAVTQAVPGAK